MKREEEVKRGPIRDSCLHAACVVTRSCLMRLVRPAVPGGAHDGVAVPPPLLSLAADHPPPCGSGQPATALSHG